MSADLKSTCSYTLWLATAMYHNGGERCDNYEQAQPSKIAANSQHLAIPLFAHRAHTISYAPLNPVLEPCTKFEQFTVKEHDS
jgi:hypothetical protein